MFSLTCSFFFPNASQLQWAHAPPTPLLVLFFFCCCSFFGYVWPIFLCLLSKWNKRDGKKQVQVLKRAKNPETELNVNKSSPQEMLSVTRLPAWRDASVQALHTVDTAAACHRHYSTSCVVLCSAAPPHCVFVCARVRMFVCVPLRPSRKKSPHRLLFHKQDGLSPLHPHDSH